MQDSISEMHLVESVLVMRRVSGVWAFIELHSVCILGFLFCFSRDSVPLMWSSAGPRHTLWHHTSFIKFTVALLKDGLGGRNKFFGGQRNKAACRL